MKKLLFIILFLIATPVLAAPIYRQERTLIPETTNYYDLGSTTLNKIWRGIYSNLLTVSGTSTLATTTISNLCLSGTCNTAWPLSSNWTVTAGGQLTPTSTIDILASKDIEVPKGNYYKYNGVNMMSASTTKYNIAIGQDSLTKLFTTLTGTGNIGIGYQALYSNTTGNSNVSLGYNTLIYNTTASNNTAIGNETLLNNRVGAVNNTGIGVSSLRTNNSGFNNSALGYQSAYSNAVGGEITSVGYNSLYTQNIAGASTTALGAFAGYSDTTGKNNVFLGYSACRNLTTDSNILCIDNQDRGASTTEATSSLIYGTFNATPASQTLFLNASTTISQNLTVAGITTLATTTLGFGSQFGNGIRYVSIDKIDLGAVGQYAEFSGFSDGAFGNIFSIADNLIIRNKSGGTGASIFFANSTGATTSQISYNEGLNIVTVDKDLWSLGSNGMAANNFTVNVGGDIRPLADSTSSIHIAQADGTDFVTFDTTNKRVAIGGINPTSQLHISSDVADASRGLNVSQHNDTIASALIYFTKSRGTGVAPTAVGSADNIGAFFGQAYTGTQYLTTAGWGYKVNGTVTSTSAPTDLIFGLNATGITSLTSHERMRLTSSGYLGIGTTTPSNALEVSGDTFLGGNLTATGTLTVTGTGTSSIASDLKVNGSTFYIDTTNGVGRVAIGTTTPNLQFEVVNQRTAAQGGTDRGIGITQNVSAIAQAQLTFKRSRGTSVVPTTVNVNDSLSGIWNIAHDGTSYLSGVSGMSWLITSAALNDVRTALIFTSNPAGASSATAGEKMRLTYDGKLGIGTTTPTSLLHVVGTLADTTDLFNVSSTTASNVTTSMFKVESTGHVGIGKNLPAYKLDIQGTGNESLVQILPGRSGWTGQGLFIDSYGSMSMTARKDAANNNLFSVTGIGDSFGALSFGLDTGVPYLGLGSGAATRDIFIKRASGDLTFNFSSTSVEKFRMTDDGYLGIGTTTPNALLSLWGSFSTKYEKKTTDYFVLDTDNTIVASSTSVMNIYLPDPIANDGKEFKIFDDQTDLVNIGCATGCLVNQVATSTLNAKRQMVTLKAMFGEYYIGN